MPAPASREQAWFLLENVRLSPEANPRSPASIPPPLPCLEEEQESPASHRCLAPRTIVAMDTGTFPKETQILSQLGGSLQQPHETQNSISSLHCGPAGSSPPPPCCLPPPHRHRPRLPCLLVVTPRCAPGSADPSQRAEMSSAPGVSKHKSQRGLLIHPLQRDPVTAHALLDVRTPISSGVTSVWL